MLSKTRYKIKDRRDEKREMSRRQLLDDFKEIEEEALDGIFRKTRFDRDYEPAARKSNDYLKLTSG